MNITLIGYRGTGKSTVAQQLAMALGWDWVDADVEIERRAGKSIAAIFADEGEGRFRDLESEVLADLVTKQNRVIAAGGGVVMRETNRQQLRLCGHVIWLKASPTTILKRVAECSTTALRRPNLTTAGGEAEIVKLLAERTPIYQQCADLEIDTGEKSPAEIAGEIITRLHLPLKELV